MASLQAPLRASLQLQGGSIFLVRLLHRVPRLRCHLLRRHLWSRRRHRSHLWCHRRHRSHQWSRRRRLIRLPCQRRHLSRLWSRLRRLSHLRCRLLCLTLRRRSHPWSRHRLLTRRRLRSPPSVWATLSHLTLVGVGAPHMLLGNSTTTSARMTGSSGCLHKMCVQSAVCAPHGHRWILLRRHRLTHHLPPLLSPLLPCRPHHVGSSLL
jgi:hypothetical protein